MPNPLAETGFKPIISSREIRISSEIPKHKSLSNTFNNGYQKLSILQRINPDITQGNNQIVLAETLVNTKCLVA